MKNGVEKSSIFKGPKIATKLLVLFLLVGLLPLAVFGYVNYVKSIRVTKDEVIKTLDAIVASRINYIEDYVIDRQLDSASLARTPFVRRAIEEFDAIFYPYGINSAQYIKLERKYRPFFKKFKESYGFHDILLISPEGNVIFSVIKEADLGTNLKTGPFKDTELAKVSEEVQAQLDAKLSDFKYYLPSDEPAAFIGTPIFREEKFIGVIATQMKTTIIYELARDYTSLGETGEMVLALKMGNEAVFVTPVKHEPDAAFRRKITLESAQAVPIQRAVQGMAGVGIMTDYRGKEVLAVWSHLPLLKWGIVVKIDTKEAFAPIYKLRNWLLFFGAVTVVIVILVAIFISASFSGPIVRLTKSTKSIAIGDLSKRVKIESSDEIGSLSQSFNEMSDELQMLIMSRDKEIGERSQAEEQLHKLVAEREILNHELQEKVQKLEKSRKAMLYMVEDLNITSKELKAT